jgi:hypothetical protein
MYDSPQFKKRKKRERALQRSIGGRSVCADYSRMAGEEMAGTVKPVDLWLLIEYRARWEREAISVFSPAVQSRLAALRARIPKTRLALIRQPDRQSGPLNLYRAFSRESGPRIFRTEFTSYEELSFDTDCSGTESDENLYAVCTHGSHDLCCAKYGNRIYSELRAATRHVWQISHIGGCRFAPNVVCLPHGVVYGRVEPADCAAIVSTYKDSTLFTRKLRGRSCYAKPVQAAERFLRNAKQYMALDDLKVTRAEETEPGRWSMTFLSRDANQHRVTLVARGGAASTYRSC